MDRPEVHKYYLIPGFVTSRWDGQEHWVNSDQLMHLYGVRVDECAVLVNDSVDVAFLVGLPNLVLRPDPSGRYVIPGRFRIVAIWEDES